MTKYFSKYPELSFYVKGVERKFDGGLYKTKTAEEDEVLSNLSDVTVLPEDSKSEVAEDNALDVKAPIRSRKTSAK